MGGRNGEGVVSEGERDRSEGGRNEEGR
jgi:hypothetical protein